MYTYTHTSQKHASTSLHHSHTPYNRNMARSTGVTQAIAHYCGFSGNTSVSNQQVFLATPLVLVQQQECAKRPNTTLQQVATPQELANESATSKANTHPVPKVHVCIPWIQTILCNTLCQAHKYTHICNAYACVHVCVCACACVCAQICCYMGHYLSKLNYCDC